MKEGLLCQTEKIRALDYDKNKEIRGAKKRRLAEIVQAEIRNRKDARYGELADAFAKPSRRDRERREQQYGRDH